MCLFQHAHVSLSGSLQSYHQSWQSNSRMASETDAERKYLPHFYHERLEGPNGPLYGITILKSNTWQLQTIL